MLRKSFAPIVIVFLGVGVLEACGGAIAPDSNRSGARGSDPSESIADTGAPPGDFEDEFVMSDAAPASVGNASQGVDAGGGDWLLVDGVTCTSVSHQVQTDGAPCGTTWMLDVTATCAGIGGVHLHLMSESDLPYPQTCNGNDTISCGDEGIGIINASLMVDGGGTYSSRNTGGGCSMSTGPTTVSQDMPVTGLQGKVANDAGVVATFDFEPGLG
jgi:hypothetical protein